MYDDSRFIEWLRTEPPFSDWDEGYGNRMTDDARGLLAEIDALRKENAALKVKLQDALDARADYLEKANELNTKWESVPWDALRLAVSDLYEADRDSTYDNIEVLENWIIFNAPKEA